MGRQVLERALARVLPKLVQKPHPNMYLACTQSSSFDLAAQKGIGVLSSASYATTVLESHVKTYKEKVSTQILWERSSLTTGRTTSTPSVALITRRLVSLPLHQ